jgi:hypothetical protein
VVNRCFNLLTKDDSRAALADEIEPDRPEVPIVSGAFLSAGGAEGLAWTGSSPDGSVVSIAGASQRIGPDADAGEEVALGISHKFIWLDIFNAPLINITLGNMAGFD